MKCSLCGSNLKWMEEREYILLSLESEIAS